MEPTADKRIRDKDRIRNKERPYARSFSTTPEVHECVKILALQQGIPSSQFIHNAVCKEVRAILDGQGSSEKEFIEKFRAFGSATQTA